jgi:hypothetical protein
MRSHPHIPIISVVAIAAAALLAAGCGGGSSATAANTTQNGLATYSNCMRSHGVSGFPDPDRTGTIPKVKILPLVNSPQFRVAERACQHLMPESGLGGPGAAHSHAQIAAGLAFARCVRSHGFPNFPDPTARGELTPQMVTAAGIDLHQPAVLQAGDACVGVTHGLITRAAVARAVNGG